MQHLDLLRSQYPSATPHTIQVKHHATFQSWFANQIIMQLMLLELGSCGAGLDSWSEKQRSSSYKDSNGQHRFL
ncbi:hypothetical protein LINPERPRIM_LOCUS38996 [Linum perenne]